MKSDFGVEKRSKDTVSSVWRMLSLASACTHKFNSSNTQWDLQFWFPVKKYGLTIQVKDSSVYTMAFNRPRGSAEPAEKKGQR